MPRKYMSTVNTRAANSATLDLFDRNSDTHAQQITIAPGAVLLKEFVLPEFTVPLIDAVQLIAERAPFRHMVTPGGYRMSMAITNCGAVGWVSEQSGYRYAPFDPINGLPWPQLPSLFIELAQHAAQQAGFSDFAPDTCLLNCYTPGARLSLHQDKNERDFSAPIVSVSLGMPAQFLFGAVQRKQKVQRLLLQHGDVVVWGGPARLAYHGVAPLAASAPRIDHHPFLSGRRINLTFRKAL
jgi:alkylated DNA repair protein (DNA oxidative demethylase)